MTGADVAPSPKQPSPKQRWRESFADPGGEAFAAIVSADVELDGSAMAGAHSRHEAGQRARAIGLLAASSGRPGMPDHRTGYERRRAMAYGHAERNLALLRRLEAETQQLLENLNQPDPEQSAWLQEVTSRGDDR